MNFDDKDYKFIEGIKNLHHGTIRTDVYKDCIAYTVGCIGVNVCALDIIYKDEHVTQYVILEFKDEFYRVLWESVVFDYQVYGNDGSWHVIREGMDSKIKSN